MRCKEALEQWNAFVIQITIGRANKKDIAQSNVIFLRWSSEEFAMNGCDADGHLVRMSFDSIKQALTQLVSLSRDGATPAAIVRRIELCEFLLSEIVGIHAALSMHVADARKNRVG